MQKIKYLIKKEIYNKDNNENILDKNDENDTNCEECDTLALISIKTDHYPNKSIRVFLSVSEKRIVTVSLIVSISSPYT